LVSKLLHRSVFQQCERLLCASAARSHTARRHERSLVVGATFEIDAGDCLVDAIDFAK
jgi:hypothetical protein